MIATLVILAIGVAFIIYKLATDNNITFAQSDESSNITTDEIGGVFVGNYTYGDIKTMKCITVVKVVEGMVYYYFTDDEKLHHRKTIHEFLTTYYKFRNGCDFTYKDKISGN